LAPDPHIPAGALAPKRTAKDGRRHWARALRNYLIAGMLVWIPIMVTVWVVRFLSRILDNSIVLLPPAWRPEALFGRYVPGFGILLSLLVLFVTGLLVRNLFGERIVAAVEAVVRRVPLIGSVYGGAKTFSETVLTDKGTSFKQVLIVEFPRKGTWSFGFLTAEKLDEVPARIGGDMIAVFVPTTPNPTTGFIVFVRREEVVFLDMSVDDAFKMILTLGVVSPSWQRRPDDARLAPQQPPP
jgi:uncharacterized membrane protein